MTVLSLRKDHIKKSVACQIFSPGDEIHDFPVEVAVLKFFEDQGLEQWVPALLYALSGEFLFGGHSRFSLSKYFSTSR